MRLHRFPEMKKYTFFEYRPVVGAETDIWCVDQKVEIPEPKLLFMLRMNLAKIQKYRIQLGWVVHIGHGGLDHL